MNQFAKRAGQQTKDKQLSPFPFVVPPVLITIIMWLTSANPLTPVGVASSYLMLQLIWGSYTLWKQQTTSSLPIFSIIGAMYWIYFVMPLFWGGRVIPV